MFGLICSTLHNPVFTVSPLNNHYSNRKVVLIGYSVHRHHTPKISHDK